MGDEREVARLLEGFEMPRPAETFTRSLEARVVAVRPRRPVGRVLIATAVVAAGALIVLLPRERTSAPEPTAPSALELARAGRYQQATVAFRTLVALDGADAAARVNLAVSMACIDDLEGALAAVMEAIRRDPDLAVAHADMAAILGRLGRLEEALACCDHALELAPEDAWTHLQRASILRALGRPAEAAAGEARARTLDPQAHLDRGGLRFVDPR